MSSYLLDICFCTVRIRFPLFRKKYFHQKELKENQEAAETLTELISAQNDACVQHKAASDRKRFHDTGGTSGRSQGVDGCGSDNCMCSPVCMPASSYGWRCKCVKGGTGKTREELKSNLFLNR